MSAIEPINDNHESDDLLSIDEAAAYLRVPVATLRYWRYCGDGPHSFRLGRHVRYWRTELVLWRADQDRHPKTASTAPESTRSSTARPRRDDPDRLAEVSVDDRQGR